MIYISFLIYAILIALNILFAISNFVLATKTGNKLSMFSFGMSCAAIGFVTAMAIAQWLSIGSNG